MGRSTRDAVCPISTRRFASAYGSGLINTPFTRAKTAAVAPIPKASVRATGTENPGWRTRRRSAWRASNTESLLISQRHHRIHPPRSSRGEITRDQRDDREQSHDAYERRRIACAHPVQQRGEQTSDCERDHDADNDPRRREPDAELAPPLPDGIRKESVDADRGEQQRGSGEAAQEPHVEPP